MLIEKETVRAYLEQSRAFSTENSAYIIAQITDLVRLGHYVFEFAFQAESEDRKETFFRMFSEMCSRPGVDKLRSMWEAYAFTARFPEKEYQLGLKDFFAVWAIAHEVIVEKEIPIDILTAWLKKSAWDFGTNQANAYANEIKAQIFDTYEVSLIIVADLLLCLRRNQSSSAA